MNNERLILEETLFSTANGYLGIRGNLEEGVPKDYQSIRGSYINGVYGLVDITYGENCYGFPQTGETIINLFDAQGIQLIIDGDAFSMYEGKVLSLNRELNITSGVAKRIVEWVSPKGHRLLIEITRMTSFHIRECFTIDYKVKSINYTGEIEFVSTIESDVNNFSDADDPRVSSHAKKHLKVLEMNLEPLSVKGIVEGSDIEVELHVEHQPMLSSDIEGSCIVGRLTHFLEKDDEFRLVKYCYYSDNRLKHKSSITSVLDIGIDELYKKQKTYLDEFWHTAKMEIIGEPSVEEAINYNIYQLLSSAGKDGYSNIAAKGLSGEGYEGHYFWDTEIYMLPLFSMTSPKVAEKLLYFRYRTLKQSILEGKNLGHNAAKVPWRTISGVESSPYYPAGSAQYHINADVAYAYIQYYLLTNDLDMMRAYGLEYLYETAKLWLEVGHEKDEKYFINGVTGPDEYSALVNNNYYTNAMVQYHLKWTVKLSEQLNISYPLISQMKAISENMYLPYDKTLNVHLQDDGYLDRKPWDFEESEGKHPLLLHYHPLYIYRHQVLKQADTVLAHFLLDEENRNILKNSYELYEKNTTHDSSLSYCVYGMIAAKLGDIEKAYAYFKKTIRLDLDDLHGNTKDGLHVANSGGAYMFVPFGFGGLRIKEQLILNPVLPKAWKGYKFRFLYHGQVVTVSVSDIVKITCKGLRITIYGETYYVKDQITIKTRNEQ